MGKDTSTVIAIAVGTLFITAAFAIDIMSKSNIKVVEPTVTNDFENKVKKMSKGTLLHNYLSVHNKKGYAYRASILRSEIKRRGISFPN